MKKLVHPNQLGPPPAKAKKLIAPLPKMTRWHCPQCGDDNFHAVGEERTPHLINFMCSKCNADSELFCLYQVSNPKLHRWSQ